MKAFWFAASNNAQFQAALRGLRIHWPDASINATRDLPQARLLLKRDAFDLVFALLGAEVNEALEFIFATQQGHDIPLVAMAGDGVNPEERVLAMEAGADTMIVQPWNEEGGGGQGDGPTPAAELEPGSQWERLGLKLGLRERAAASNRARKATTSGWRNSGGRGRLTFATRRHIWCSSHYLI